MPRCLIITAAERMLNEAAQDAVNNMELDSILLARRGLAEEAVQVDKSKNVKRVVHSFRKTGERYAEYVQHSHVARHPRRYVSSAI